MRIALLIVILTSGLACEKTIHEAKGPSLPAGSADALR